MSTAARLHAWQGCARDEISDTFKFAVAAISFVVGESPHRDYDGEGDLVDVEVCLFQSPEAEVCQLLIDRHLDRFAWEYRGRASEWPGVWWYPFLGIGEEVACPNVVGVVTGRFSQEVVKDAGVQEN